MLWYLVACLFFFQDEAVSFLAPPDAQITIVSGSSLSNDITLDFVSPSDLKGFLSCFWGPKDGCVITINELPACWDHSFLNFTVWTCLGMSPAQFAACQQFDFDGDNDVDLADFAVFQNQYNVPAPHEAQRGVWVEINSGTPEEMQILADGIPLWEPVVDFVLVSTTPGHSGLYAEFLASQEALGTPMTVPLIPGLKPSPLFDCTVPSSDGTHSACNLNDPAAWKALANELSVFKAATGSDIILLENEGLVYGHTIGDIELDPVIIRAGIDLFPKDVMYYWYPAVSSYYVERRERQEILCRIAAEVLPKIRFVDGSHGRHSRLFLDFKEESILATEGLVDSPIMNYIFVYPDQSFWQDEQVPRVLKYLFPDKDIMLYPGQSGFVHQGEVFGNLLPKRRPGAKSNGVPLKVQVSPG